MENFAVIIQSRAIGHDILSMHNAMIIIEAHVQLQHSIVCQDSEGSLVRVITSVSVCTMLHSS